MEYKHILIGTDGSELMETVYERCAYLARLTNATLNIVFSVLDRVALQFFCSLRVEIHAAWFDDKS